MTIKKLNAFLFAAVVALQGCGSGTENHKPAPTPEPEPEPMSIVDVAVANGSFTTLVTALEATGLDVTLSDMDSSFTVFAPTDDAFALLGDETITALLDDTETLSDILTYHVIGSEIDSTAAISSAGSTVEMVNGDSTGLSLDGDSLLVNTVTVTTVDVEADNGVIHVIDAVLIPPVDKGTPTMNIVDTAVAAGDFGTLVTALQAAGLDATLADETQSFTVFAPTDAAFAMIDPDTLDLLLADTEALSDVLLQHVVSGEVSSVTAYTLNGLSAATASGAEIPVAINSELDTLTFGGATVTTTDIYTTNGVIHVIDMVVVADVELPSPPASIVDVAVANGSFTTLVAALQATGLDTVLDDPDATFTVFAPTDAAFSLLGQETIDALLADTETLSDILLYHVIPGSEVLQDSALTVAQSDANKVEMANGAETALSLANNTLFVNKSAVSLADVMADNGVIHVVDQVITVPAAKGEPTQTIVDIAASNDDFSTLVTALTAADLVTTLSDTSATFTVFAPTNAAFDKIDDATLDGLLADTDALTAILLKHVVNNSEIDSVSAFAANGADVPSIGGDSLSVSLQNFSQTMDGASDEVAYDSASEMLVGGTNSSQPGLTLYVFDSDLGTSGSACNDGCATTWPPVVVDDAEVDNIPGLSLITRDDGSLQAAFKGRPLYFYANDTAAGDTNGQAVNNAWWKVDQEQVELQVQGSGVTTFDLYGTNGVIHVIDTVITN
ncbi:MAG: adhesin [Porticoccaceae bacterium]|jgi:transforming growth factor-beta-induced protein|nr:adhesin [Porticoccaceae bacterium]MDB2670062.1 fasciclin domain-containing protein [Porticoccaceae bacterium]MDC0524344.1 fasciclin domain-containing protein [Porticoccaceae bacterium]